MGRNLIDLDDLSTAELNALLDRAARFAIEAPPPTLRDVSVVNLFFEPSTRTFVSFSIAEQALGARVVSLNPDVSSFVKGETIRDTAATLGAMGVGVAVVRHSQPGFVGQFASAFSGSIVNGGDGAHAHPTQALLDLLTMRDEFGRIEGLRVAIVGDVLHSRVARSNALGLRMLGAHVTFVGPPTVVPAALAGDGVQVAHRLDPVLPEVDVLMLLRVQRERATDAVASSLDDYLADFRIDRDRLAQLPSQAIVMHPGPYNRGIELTDDVPRSARWRYAQQVRNGVFVRMAVLDFLVNGAAQPLALA